MERMQTKGPTLLLGTRLLVQLQFGASDEAQYEKVESCACACDSVSEQRLLTSWRAMGDGDNVSTLESKPLESGHAPVNGINMYYEVHGRKDGVPLVLLHGGRFTIEVAGGASAWPHDRSQCARRVRVLRGRCRGPPFGTRRSTRWTFSGSATA